MMYDPCMDCVLQYKPKSLHVKVIIQINIVRTVHRIAMHI